MTATTVAEEQPHIDPPPAGASDSEPEPEAADGEGGRKPAAKKKKKKPKSKKPNYAENGGGVPPRTPTTAETPEEAARWAAELAQVKPFSLEPWDVMADRAREKVGVLLTPACAGLCLRTPRVLLRPVRMGDSLGIKKIKTEPVVQKTQLYGHPKTLSEIKANFQTRYIASCAPALSRDEYAPDTDDEEDGEAKEEGGGGAWRDEYIWAITVKPAKAQEVRIAPAGDVRLQNRLTNLEGYVGNIALSLSCNRPLRPQKGQVWTHPTAQEARDAQLEGKMFYELHPQLWGQGIIGEVFREVLRFAFDEVLCTKVSADPTVGNDASIRLCERNGMAFEYEKDNHYGKPQLFYSVTREEWTRRYRGGSGIDAWGGRETCRWCLDFRRDVGPTCACGWAKYCSRECQRADWAFRPGHRRECDAKK